MSITKKILIKIIRRYQKIISPVLKREGYKCLFDPTCSDHALFCLKKYSVVKAVFLIIFRVASCNPVNAYLKSRHLKITNIYG